MEIEQENKMILNAYRGVLGPKIGSFKEETKIIRRHSTASRHQSMKISQVVSIFILKVARICADEIGLGPTSIVCALLHDT